MNNDKKVFAFKLAEKKEKQEKAAPTKWQAREGLSVAGCTDPTADGMYRYSTTRVRDGGVYC